MERAQRAAETWPRLLRWLTTNCLLWGTLGRSESVYTVCSHIKNPVHFPPRTAEWCAGNITITTPQQNIQLILPDPVRWGKRKDGENVRTFCCCSVLQLLPFYFLYFSQPDWSSVSRLDLPMPRLSWGLKFHWAQHRCAWKLHILNWWLHKSRSCGNADTFGLELGRALKKKNQKNVELLLQMAHFLTWRERTLVSDVALLQITDKEKTLVSGHWLISSKLREVNIKHCNLFHSLQDS